jgi:hypothetical protein
MTEQTFMNEDLHINEDQAAKDAFDPANLSTADSTYLKQLEKIEAITESTSSSTHATRRLRKAQRQNRKLGRRR